MSQIEVTINDRDYKVACEDGQEDHVRQLARYVDKHIENLTASLGQVGDARLLVLASLVIADELSEMSFTVRSVREQGNTGEGDTR